jgi:hypothetical protein
MKKGKLFLLGTLIIGMAFGLALTGCPTGSDDPTVEELAAQLAADINSIAEETAEVSGDTVTITGRVGIESPLTVPTGVTVDLTGDGQLVLVDATLTVNGTVKAGANRVRMGSAASEGTINGSGTIQLKGTGQLLIVEGNENHSTRTLTLDGVTLVGVANNDQSLVAMNNGGEFIMKSGTISGNTFNGNGDWAGGGGVNIGGGSTFTMESGTISGNTVKANRWSRGGGVCIDGGTFNMKGGEISGNTAAVPETGDNGGGGGVFGTRGSTFIMEGGTISGNKLTGGVGGDSGGVRVETNAVFTLKGGTIYGKAESLPAGVDASLANSSARNAALSLGNQDDGQGFAAVKWGTGGTYTKGGESQTEGSDIVPHTEGENCGTDDTLIAIPAP